MCAFRPACPLTRTDHRRNAPARTASEGLSGRRFLADPPGTVPGAPSAEDHMRTTRALAASAAAVAALGLAAPAAVADGMNTPSNVTALPSAIARGGQLTITVNNCSTPATASSDAFQTVTLTSGTGGLATGTARVDNNARQGSHSITVTCRNGVMTNPNAFTVIGAVRGGLGGSSATGATPTDMAIGGGLVAAAVIGGGVFWMRRRSEKRI
ncbi:MAG: hypothetical protein HOV73_19865 [Streptomyces sp.]|nr:hypothetical protein [Streptomyces sp.]NUR65514.1 hypothetical protein [Streptomyces sp.]NUS75683.1 hypothetical protein [Streptomyces sp.]